MRKCNLRKKAEIAVKKKQAEHNNFLKKREKELQKIMPKIKQKGRRQL